MIYLLLKNVSVFHLGCNVHMVFVVDSNVHFVPESLWENTTLCTLVLFFRLNSLVDDLASVSRNG